MSCVHIEILQRLRDATCVNIEILCEIQLVSKSNLRQYYRDIERCNLCDYRDWHKLHTPFTTQVAYIIHAFTNIAPHALLSKRACMHICVWWHHLHINGSWCSECKKVCHVFIYTKRSHSLKRTTHDWSLSPRGAVRFNVLQCVAVCCRVLQFVAVCCSVHKDDCAIMRHLFVYWPSSHAHTSKNKHMK